MRPSLVSCLLVSIISAVSAQEPKESARPEQVRLMQALAKEFEMRLAANRDTVLTVAESAALRYSNPVRELLSDGATFFYFDGPRPVAAVSLSIRGQPSDVRRVWAEASLVAPVPLLCRHSEADFWSPQADLPKWTAINPAPMPAGTATARLVQMRELARRFEVEVLRKEVWTASRLLTQPVARFADARTGTLDGAVFVFAEATDPEVLLVLDCRPEGNAESTAWHYLMAKMSAPPTRVRLDGKDVWSTDGFWKAPRSIGPYREAVVGDYEPLKTRLLKPVEPQ
jgi:hypothetical protein